MRIVPITQKAAFQFIKLHHRHHKPPRGSVFQIGLETAGVLVAVVIVGRPVSRMLQDGRTLEVTRMCSLGNKNACSKLYGAAWRAARSLGWSRLVTYTLPQEGGASLRGAGWTLIGEAGGGSWSRERRLRVDKHPTQIKFRWEKSSF